ncbi:MAG: gliding motility-associated C-terminal domain-containing protein [Flavobacteriales bacterium]|nr:gliding motility-associated C-terminal domain-containing protein [Flavobacteriales bacterium]
MKFYSFILIVTFGFFSKALSQATICLGDDITVCAGTSVTIENCTGNTGNAQGIVLDNITPVTLNDDEWSNAVNIGFPFNFYGIDRTECVIGSNGLISFDLAKAGGYCSWDLSGAGNMPNPGFDDAKSAVMLAYQDMNPSAFVSPIGQIGYQTIGLAPNRMFIVLYKDINFFSCETVCNYMSVILYEGSNNIEVQIGDKPLCADWNDGLSIQGIQDDAGLNAVITPGRNNAQWAANQECKRWTPNSPGNTNSYTISDEPYILVTSISTEIQWEDTEGNTYPYNNGVLVIDPVEVGTIGYSISGSACGASLGTISETSWVTGVNSGVEAFAIDDICSAGLGEVTANPTAGSPAYSFNWPELGANTQTVTGVPAGNYTVNMTDGNGCVATANVTVGDTPAAFQSATTIVSCPGGNDGTAFAEMIPELGNVTYQWDDLALQTTQTAVNLAAGTYNCVVTSDIGCAGLVTVNIAEIPGMIGTITSITNVSCNSGNNGSMTVNVTQGTEPYTYSWNNSASTDETAADLVAGDHTVTITDSNGCIITIDGNLTEPEALSIDFITPDTQICPEEKITLEVNGAGGSSDYTFTWTENGIFIGNGTEILVDPTSTDTDYCVELSEECGSPEAQECIRIYFPTPIEPSALPDFEAKCIPDTFYFENTSANLAEIATTFWEFGDNVSHVETTNGSDPVSHFYNTTGFYSITLTTTSIFGCVYTNTMENLIEVVPSPIADFNFSKNPTTIFETGILMQNKSSFDVVDWQWFSPGSEPTLSSAVNPSFMFPENKVNNYPVTLVVTNERGCIDTTRYILQVVEDILFFAPNAFTPDGNELNNLWKPEISGIDIYDFDLYIYNRWGEVIWENHDPSRGWDGTYKGRLVTNDTYIWVATVKNPYNDDKRTFNGSMVLLSGDSKFSPE